jgi:D-inositol-3-phosphate glycosyltransferase
MVRRLPALVQSFRTMGSRSEGLEMESISISERSRVATRPVRRLAVLSYHSSPLTEPGSGDAGGMTVYVRAVAAAHAAAGVHTDIFTRASSRGGRVARVAEGVRVVSIDAGPATAIPKQEMAHYIDDFATGVQVFAAMQRVSYDLVHSHYWQSGLAGLGLTEKWGVPLVHSQHTLARVKNLYLAPGDTPEPRARIDGEKRVISSADVLIPSTDDEWEQLSCLYGASHDRMKIIHPGIDHAVFKPGDGAAARARLGLSPDHAVILCVGRIQPLKGLSLAVRAAAELAPQIERELAVLIVGGPSTPAGEAELARLRKLADELSLGSRVRFLGPQPHEELPELYRAADVLAVCSRTESFGLAALEAHACGVPVVATAVGGLKYVVHNGLSGWLLESADPSLMAARIRPLLADERLQESFSQAAAASARRFSWERTGAELLELYSCLLAAAAPEACTC